MIEARSVVHVPVGGPDPKRRVAVVLDGELRGTVFVAYVTGSDRELPRVTVELGSRNAKALGLYKRSFFYVANMAAVPTKLCMVQRGTRCPPDLYDQLIALRKGAFT